MTNNPTTPAHDESARRLETLLSNLPGMAYRCRADSAWTMEFVSEGCRALTGYTPEELTSGEAQQFARLIAPMDRHAVEAEVRAALAAGAPFTLEYRLVDRSGRIKHVWERGRLVAGDGESAVIEGFITDITPLKRTEVDLGERIKELRFSYEVTALCSSGQPLESVLWTIVERAPAAYRYPPEVAARISLLGKSYASPRFYAREHCPRQSAPIVADGQTIGEIEVCRVSGAESPDYFLREEQDMLSAVAVRIGELIERERMLEALRAGERKARALYQCLPVPTVVWQRRGDEFVLVDHNAAARASTAGFVEACVGRPVRELLPAHPDVAADIERCFAAGAPSSREIEHRLPDGRTLVLVVSLGFVPPDLVLAHVADVTVERRLQERFHQAQKMEVLGRMAAGVAHDFNNMLTVILSYSDILLRAAAPDDPGRADLLEIRKAGERAAALTQQLTTFSRQQVVRSQVVDLNRQIADVARMLEQLLDADRELILALADEPCPVQLHPPQFDQVLFNLIVNARDATPRGGRVTIETALIDIDEAYARTLVDVSPGPFVMVAVSDTGTGMDAATRARVFEPFFTTKPAGMGTGMGLATVYGIVKQGGGHVSVYSEPGRGSTFRLYFPRAEATPSALLRIARSEPPHRARGSETILVVEDEEPIRRLVQRVLTAAGYRVLTAANGAEARLLCERHHEAIDLLLTDIVLPWESGPELAAALPRTVPDLRVLFMSGYTERAAREAIALQPDMNFIAKPFTAEMLTRVVRDVLDRPPVARR